MSSFSVLSGTSNVLLNLGENQQNFLNTVTQLSSGLRINSAADDPSGNAIATNLTSKVQGLQQSVTNVQNATNTLNVANGALSTVNTILLRINSLIVESNSDINSQQDLQDIQNEINSLLSEVNKIGQTTNFNGLNLLDGAFDDSPGSGPTFTQVASPFGSGSANVSNATGAGQPGPLITFPAGTGVPLEQGFFQPALLVFTITGFSQNAVDPDSNTSVGPGVFVQFDAFSASGGLGTAPLFQDVSAVAVNSGVLSDAQIRTPNGAQLLIEFNLSNLTQNDVGTSVAFVSSNGTQAGTGTTLTVNDGGDEGQIVGFSLPTVSTTALGLSNISVLPTQVINFQNQLQGASSSNNIVASASELAVQSALTQVTTAQAKIGAQQVALNDDSTNDNTAIVNYQQSVSSIADLNVGQATTKFTQEQILTSVGTQVLSQLQNNAKTLTALLINALVA
jgi:flagellin